MIAHEDLAKKYFLIKGSPTGSELVKIELLLGY